MKVIFLDIDGVLNHNGMLRHGTDMQNYGFAPELVMNLKNLIVMTNSKVVISSSWRMGDDINEDIIGGKPWTKILEDKLNLPRIIIGKIGFEYEYSSYFKALYPDKICRGNAKTYRGYDIKEYLRLHPDIYRFVILDDYVSESDIPDMFLTIMLDANEVFRIKNL